MTCKIDGCKKEIQYKARGICQMHYFRYMRNGIYETLPTTRKQEVITPNGYRVLYIPDHPLCRSDGYVFEHRVVAYERYGETLPDCGFCGKSCDWRPYFTHIDHIDCDKLNNQPGNLRVLCNACNTGRGKGPRHEVGGRYSITLEGVTMTPTEWARQAGVAVHAVTILNRVKEGWSVRAALYTPAWKKEIKELTPL